MGSGSGSGGLGWALPDEHTREGEALLLAQAQLVAPVAHRVEARSAAPRRAARRASPRLARRPTLHQPRELHLVKG